MRIIAGKFKGRHLVSFQASHIRPTTDRVKETLFNKLMFKIEGARVLDLFSGTGNLAIEAISRGAHEVTCVESHRKSLQIIEKNKKLLEIKDEIKVIPIDVFKFFTQFDFQNFDLILVDPPFTQKWAHRILTEFPTHWMAEGAWLAIESSRQEQIEDQYEGLNLLDRRNFGDKLLSIYERKGAL